MEKTILFVGLGVVTLVIVGAFLRSKQQLVVPKFIEVAIGFITNFFDTLGIGSFATTTSMFKFWKLVPDERIPGTLNVGHTLPTILEAFIFIAIVQVDPTTLISMILASVAGAYLGAGVVAQWPRRFIQVGMGGVLVAAAALFTLKVFNIGPPGGSALALTGPSLVIGIVGNFCLGALMTLGIGLYAPCLILVSMLGMNPLAAFPIMMGSCAFLMPIASLRFVRFDAFSMRAALGLAVGGLPAVALAAPWVGRFPLQWVRVLVIFVVIYAAFIMLRSAIIEHKAAEEYAVTPEA